MEQQTGSREKFPIGRFFAWKSRDISLGCMVIIVGYLSIYASTAMGVPVGLVGVLMMASKIFDAFTDLTAGWLIDNTKTKLGKARPYEFSLIGMWISTFLLFSVPESFGLAAKAVWIFFMYTFTYSIFATLLYGSQQPYIVRAFGSRSMIIKVSSYGGIVSTLGAATVSVSFPRLMKTVADSPAGWRKLVLFYAIPLCLIGLLRLIFVKETFEPDAEKKEEKVSLKMIGMMLRRNPYVWDMGIIVGVVQLVLGMSAASYYFTFIVGDISRYSLLQAMTILMLGLMFLFPMLMRRMSIANLVVMGSVIGFAGYVVNFFAGSSLAMLMVAFFATGFQQLPGSYLQAPMLMEVSTYNEYLGLSRMDATSASVMNFMGKLFNALGAGMLGILLQLSGFIATNAGEQVAQPGSALLMIRLLYSLIPAAFMIVTILAARHFDTLSKKVPAIQEELAKRAEAESAV